MRVSVNVHTNGKGRGGNLGAEHMLISLRQELGLSTNQECALAQQRFAYWFGTGAGVVHQSGARTDTAQTGF